MRRLIFVVLSCLCLMQRFECDDSVNSVCDADSDVEKSCRQKVDVEIDRKPKKPFPGCRKFSLTDFEPDSPTIVYLESRGRLGNQIYTYGFLAQVALETGTMPYLNGRTKQLLKNAFTPDSIKIPILEETYCNTKDIPFESFHGNLLDFLNDTSYRKGRFIWLYPPNPNGKTYGGYWPSDYGLDDETLKFMQRMEETVRQTFTFHPHIQAVADETILDVSKQVKKSDPKSEINFVGIHNRRTDHLQFMQKTAKIKPIKPKYFKDAMDYYREEYENVVFLYVSDDMEWGRKNLKNKHGDLFFVGRGTNIDANGPEDNWENEDVAIDLAVLGSCNHTIISRGTFSIFASVFAHGETYTFDSGPNLPKRLLLVE